jgi:hypothetical protein
MAVRVIPSFFCIMNVCVSGTFQNTAKSSAYKYKSITED